MRPLVPEYLLMIKLADRICAHSFNPAAYHSHSWSYFDIQNLRLTILYLIYHVGVETLTTGLMLHQQR